jgi:hypothetical protein
MQITTDKLDPVSQWLVKNNFPLTLANWLEINYWRKVKLSELDADSLAEIPDYLLPKKYRSR